MTLITHFVQELDVVALNFGGKMPMPWKHLDLKKYNCGGPGEPPGEPSELSCQDILSWRLLVRNWPNPK